MSHSFEQDCCSCGGNPSIHISRHLGGVREKQWHAQPHSRCGCQVRELLIRLVIFALTFFPPKSIILTRCQAAVRNVGLHTQDGTNPQLQFFFYKLCRLLRAPATYVFVFDGPGRPAKKRGHNVVNRALWYTQYAKSLIEAFGFHWHVV